MENGRPKDKHGRPIIPPVDREEGSSEPSAREPPSDPVNQPTYHGLMDITIRSIMSGVGELRLQLGAGCLVKDLKNAIADQCDIGPEKQILLYEGTELISNDMPLASYGIKGNCCVVMNVKMSSGLPVRRPASTPSNMLCFVPLLLPQKNVPDLRSKIRAMRNLHEEQIRREPSVQEIREGNKTRDHMKSLIHKRSRKPRLLSPVSSSCNASVVGSFTSLISSESSTSINRSPSGSQTSLTTVSPEEHPVTERELKLFFETMEDERQLRDYEDRKCLMQPPQNEEELGKLKKQIEKVAKTRCRECKRRLSATEQTMHCRCKKYFCGKHMDPVQHQCLIDYRQTSRTKIAKENTKVTARKGE